MIRIVGLVFPFLGRSVLLLDHALSTPSPTHHTRRVGFFRFVRRAVVCWRLCFDFSFPRGFGVTLLEGRLNFRRLWLDRELW